MSNKDGGFAFPQEQPKYDSKNHYCGDSLRGGMTMRQYYAAHALAGILANKGWFPKMEWKAVGATKEEADKLAHEKMCTDFSTEAFALADAMIAAEGGEK